MAACRILLIEDSAIICTAIKSILNAGGISFEIVASHTITDGVGVLSDINNDFDIVITSLSLPDSFGLLSIMAITEVERDVPIIVLLDFDSEDIGEDAINYGAIDYIKKTKSSLNESLLRSVRHVITVQKLTEELETVKYDLEQALRK